MGIPITLGLLVLPVTRSVPVVHFTGCGGKQGGPHGPEMAKAATGNISFQPICPGHKAVFTCTVISTPVETALAALHSSSSPFSSFGQAITLSSKTLKLPEHTCLVLLPNPYTWVFLRALSLSSSSPSSRGRKMAAWWPH